MSLPAELARRVVVLDGGLATELERRGQDLSSRLWSARLVRDDPGAVVDVHRAFVAAGAEVVTSASYQASFDALGEDAEPLLRRSVALAREAGARWVAASVGPYGAVLREWHRRRLNVLADAGADLLAVETIPCLAEVEALCAELDAVDAPAWLSVTCTGTSTRAGEPAADAFAMARDCSAVVAFGVNCTAPHDVAELVRVAVTVGGKPIVAYPNSGEGWDPVRRTWVGERGFRASDVAGWLDAGVRLIGGCCRVRPEDIAEIASGVVALRDGGDEESGGPVSTLG
jgi:homocysteine S-methyltransferase